MALSRFSFLSRQPIKEAAKEFAKGTLWPSDPKDGWKTRAFLGGTVQLLSLSLIPTADNVPGGLRPGYPMLLDLVQQVERSQPVLQPGLFGGQ
jgi:hypothetical protein